MTSRPSFEEKKSQESSSTLTTTERKSQSQSSDEGTISTSTDDSKSHDSAILSRESKSWISNTVTSVTEVESPSEPREQPEVLTYKNVSLVTYEDVDEIRGLISEDIKVMYNVEDPFNIIHKCNTSLKITDSKNKIVGVLCADEFPNVPTLSPQAWTSWGAKLYNIKDLNSYNSMWVHFAAYNDLYVSKFLHPALNHLFHVHLKKQYIFFVVPIGYHDKLPYLEGISSVILPKDFTNPRKVQTLRMCVRGDFITQYKIRRAVEEDNDDLVPLIHEFSSRFVQLYGEYYIAEIITRHQASGRRIIVAEHGGEAVAVLCLNPHVNHSQINESFDLHAYTNFYKMETAQQKPTIKVAAGISAKSKSKHLNKTSWFHDSNNATSVSAWDISDDSTGLGENTPNSISSIKMQTFSVLNKIDQFTNEYSTASLGYSMTHSQLGSLSESDLSSDDTISSTSEDLETPPEDWAYHGIENAFAIEVLATQEKHMASLALLIISCFESYPDRDYCLLTVPHDADYSYVLKYFLKVQPRVGVSHPHVLYVCHRGQLSPIRIIVAQEEDTPRVNQFLSILKHPGEIKANFENGISGKHRITTYLALSGKKFKYVVGIAQVSPVTDLASIKAKYVVNAMSDIRYDENSSFAYFLSFSISPLFKRHTKYFLLEIHRHTNCNTLFYALNHHDSEDYRIRPLSFLMQDMWLVPPRKIQVTLKKVSNDYPEEPYALFISTPRLLNIPTIHINQRIVVVGASSTALAFLEALVRTETTEHGVWFNDVLMVSTDGLPFAESRNSVRNMFLASHTFGDLAYLEKIAIRSFINIVIGVVTSIERKKRLITIDKKVVIPYEYLFLMTGLQYGVPKKKKAKEYLKSKLPHNCFTINSEKDAEAALESLTDLMDEQNNSPYQIVIYGHSIDCYCCIAALFEIGVPGTNIILIEPWPSDEPDNNFVFQDGDVYETVVTNVLNQGVEILTGYTLIDWSTHAPLCLRFESRTRYLMLSPMCAFLYCNKNIDMNLFVAVHDAGLVFDGRLVINSECQTNDPRIYAAGPMTKYSRKMYSDHLTHDHFNSEEIGRTLGKKFRQKLLPFQEKPKPNYNLTQSNDHRSEHLVPVYFQPLTTYCRLPGGLYYLNVCTPGQQIPMETAMSDTDYGSVICTGNCRTLKERGYFRLHLNKYKTIETITCLSMQQFDHKKFVMLWGKHEALLNNLVRRFETFYITDLFAYFQKAWCSAIFIEDFALLENAMMKIMTSLTDIPGESPLEDLYRLYKANGFKPLSKEEREMINTKFNDSGYDKTIQTLIMDFIRDNLGVLDMYAHPIIVNYLLSGYEESPLFKKI